MRPNTRNHSQEALGRARKLRAESSVSEKVFWEMVRKDRLGFRFKRQVSIGGYTLDFYCPEASLCIEIDGEHHADRQPQDAQRDLWLGQKGIATIRIPSLDLFEETSLVAGEWLRRIEETCTERAKRS